MGTFIHGPMVYLFVFLFAVLFACLLAGRIVLSNGLDHWIFLIFHRTSIAHAGGLHFLPHSWRCRFRILVHR